MTAITYLLQRQEWEKAGHDWEPRVSVSRPIFPIVDGSDAQEEIVRKIFSDKSEDEIKAYLNEKFEEFSALQEIRKVDNEEFKKKFCEYLKNAPVLDFLSRLEHKRWCNSYYAMNFKYGEKKDENLKTHPCLIDDWNIIIGEKFDTCHPEYDLLSVFTLFQREE